VAAGMLLATAIFVSCSGPTGPKLRVAGIPDQSATSLARRYDALTVYLEKQLGVEVEYVPTVDYAATIVAFAHGTVQLAWFGGLSGVMARQRAPGSTAIAQRPRDEQFHSVFIVGARVEAEGLADLAGMTFTFGSELSTSGHLMPRHFLVAAGIDPDVDFKNVPNYSGSHDRTWKLVESGAFEAGALSEAVWEVAVDAGRVDLSKVRELTLTPPYPDYNWTVHGNIDDEFGEGFAHRITDALLAIDAEVPEILELFSAQGFIPAGNASYRAIEEAAEHAGIIE
jgi:phosphonate transport system substrate-binding protein